MNDKLALFFDIDGTLFHGKTKSVLPSTIYCLEKLKNNPNVDMYLSTGRSYSTLGKLKGYIDYFTGLNLTNGQEIYVGGKKISESYLDKDVVKSLLEISEEMNTPLGLITSNDIVMNFFTPRSEDNFTTYIRRDVTNLDHAPFDINIPVMQIWLFATNEEIEIIRTKVENATFLNWGRYGADVISLDSSKANGIVKIQNIFGYKFENLYAFGDGDNDAKMFDVVKTSVAMGNGSQLAKEHATFVTDKIIDDGLYKALVKLGLVEVASKEEQVLWHQS